MRLLRGPVAGFCLATVGFATLSTEAKSQENLHQLGLELSKKHCARCHVIDRKNLFGGISSTPSFPLMVNNLEDWEERFLSFHTRLPHPSIVRFEGEPVDPDKPELMAPVILQYSDIEALAAYARTLKKAK